MESFKTNLNSASAQKSTVETIRRDALIGALALKLRVARYRALVLLTEEEQPLDRILAQLHAIVDQLGALPHREETQHDDERIGLIARRYMGRWAVPKSDVVN